MIRAVGEMPEWPNGTDSKSVVPSRVPRVQIPISPPYSDTRKPLIILEISGASSFQGSTLGKKRRFPVRKGPLCAVLNPIIADTIPAMLLVSPGIQRP